jgi:nucleoside phosphorylase
VDGRIGKTVVGVITIIDEEFEAAKAALAATERCQDPPRKYWHQPGHSGRFVLVRAADRGNVPAGEVTRSLIEHWQPDIVLLVGIAGDWRPVIWG